MPAWLSNFLAIFRPYAPHIDPPVIPCADRAAAWSAALEISASVFGGVEITSGTPSMVPLIPAAPTFLAVKPIRFADARLGTVCSYRAAWLNNQTVCHRLVAQDSLGFIPSGDNNRYSEADGRVTSANLIGEVVGIFTFPTEANASVALRSPTGGVGPKPS